MEGRMTGSHGLPMAEADGAGGGGRLGARTGASPECAEACRNIAKEPALALRSSEG